MLPAVFEARLTTHPLIGPTAAQSPDRSLQGKLRAVLPAGHTSTELVVGALSSNPRPGDELCPQKRIVPVDPHCQSGVAAAPDPRGSDSSACNPPLFLQIQWSKPGD